MVNNQIWEQNSTGIVGGAEAFDYLGLSLAGGDFDGDGRDDLAIGVPGEDIGNISSAGATNVLYGSFSGLTSANNQIWEQNSTGIVGGAEAVDNFGSDLATGDFDGDGREDLAIGVRGEDIGNITNAGAVNVLYGSFSGLTSANNQIWEQNTTGVEGGAESYDRFGDSLATGDFDGDGRDDLAIGVKNEDTSDRTNDGAVNVLYGSAAGLTASDDQIWGQNTTGVVGAAESDDRFGSSLAGGDFDGDGREDLAIGVEGEDIGNIANAGAVNVLYGSFSGLNSANNQIWEQNTSGIVGAAESDDRLGSSVATGDFDGDGRDDLAIGVPGEDIGNLTNAGAVNVIYGSATGLTSANNQIWEQNSPGIAGAAESFDNFGASVATGDFNGDGRDDLAVGVFGEDIGNVTNAGAVNVIYGSATGLTSTDNQIWEQNSPGIVGGAEAFDSFGASVSTGDFNQDGFDDLAIGVPGEDIGNISSAGATNILYGSATGLTA